ncbi:conserved hypothetical protein [Ricinus communis]|uniref:Uncharacterized protein n=1 Tax=Ricinus communis TaxID=3988 RepID=B9T4K1_RICCO|nr:conserved hypothetical protein [Ricinus communis]
MSAEMTEVGDNSALRIEEVDKLLNEAKIISLFGRAIVIIFGGNDEWISECQLLILNEVRAMNIKTKEEATVMDEKDKLERTGQEV